MKINYIAFNTGGLHYSMNVEGVKQNMHLNAEDAILILKTLHIHNQGLNLFNAKYGSMQYVWLLNPDYIYEQ